MKQPFSKGYRRSIRDPGSTQRVEESRLCFTWFHMGQAGQRSIVLQLLLHGTLSTTAHLTDWLWPLYICTPDSPPCRAQYVLYICIACNYNGGSCTHSLTLHIHVPDNIRTISFIYIYHSTIYTQLPYIHVAQHNIRTVYFIYMYHRKIYTFFTLCTCTTAQYTHCLFHIHVPQHNLIVYFVYMSQHSWHTVKFV